MRVLYNTPIRTIYSKGIEQFAVGIEVEMETRNRGEQFPILPVPNLLAYWSVKGDGSLRYNGHEAVSKPLPYDKVVEALKELESFVDLKKLSNKSPRTSVHVHVNMGDKTLSQVINLVCIYTLFEDLLLELSGKTRLGNNFALSTQTAEGFIDNIKQFIQSNEKIFFGENDRYSSLNLACLRQFGTAEFRSMRGLTDTKEMKEWVDIIKGLYDVAVAYRHPKEMFSGGLNRLIPKALLEYFSEERILEVANSNHSSALSLVYCHKTDWDFDDPTCDIRCDDQFFNWWTKVRGYSATDMMRSSTRDLEISYRKFLATQNLTGTDAEQASNNGNWDQPVIRLNPRAEENFWVVNDDIEVV